MHRGSEFKDLATLPKFDFMTPEEREGLVSNILDQAHPIRLLSPSLREDLARYITTESVDKLLDGAFAWNETPEGFDYWLKVFEKYYPGKLG